MQGFKKSINIAVAVSVGAMMMWCVEAKAQSIMSEIDSARAVMMLTGEHWRSDEKVELIGATVRSDGAIRLLYSEAVATCIITEEKLNALTDSIRRWTGRTSGEVRLMAGSVNLRSLVARWEDKRKGAQRPLVMRNDSVQGNLSGRHIALWASHGMYYEQSLQRWEWQRARLYCTVEDLLTSAFAVEFLLPMLENAGATVLMPRERDANPYLLYIDNDAGGLTLPNCHIVSKLTGFKAYTALHGNDNPFRMGTSVEVDMKKDNAATFAGRVEQKGWYSVSICYKSNEANCDAVEYIVTDAIGSKSYIVDQRRGGGMWVHLGWHECTDSIKVTVRGEGRVSLDAVKIGGGMGAIERGGSTSQRPRYQEGARYYLQENGFDAAQVYSLSEGKNDYTDDVNARGEWVNSLERDKGIRIDASIALHTDAGVAKDDSIVGTLAIVSTRANNGVLSDGRKRSVSRALAYGISEQITHDIRQLWAQQWSCRGCRDKGYSEARRPSVPSVLVEMLSHQNINDMSHAHHPAFRHDICRAIYKGLLRTLEGNDAIIQPLMPQKFGMELTNDNELTLHWSPQHDMLEPTAEPDFYEILCDGMTIMATVDTFATVTAKRDGRIHKYAIVAVNRGGRSFASQELAACLIDGSEPVALVDGNVRLAAPDTIKALRYNGFMLLQDAGSGYKTEHYITGTQYDVDPSHEWIDDDAPGCGASHADMELTPTCGSYNIPRTLVDTLRHRGQSFVSMSKSYYETSCEVWRYNTIILYMGNLRTSQYGLQGTRHSIYTEAFMDKTEAMKSNGTKLILIGNYIGTDIQDERQAEFCSKIFGFKHRTDHASQTRTITANGTERLLNMQRHAFAASPDAIEPSQKQAVTTYRYGDTKASAAVRYGNTEAYGFAEE